MAACLALGSVSEPLLGAWLLSRKGKFDPCLRSSTDALRLFVLAGALSPVVGALAAIGTLWLAGQVPATDFWRGFVYSWMGDALGVVLVAPLMLATHGPHRLARKSVPEAALVLGTTFAVGQILFLGWLSDILGPTHHGYLLYLIVAWAAVRLGLRAVLAVIVGVLLQALAGTLRGLGLFANDLAQTQVLDFWAFMTILATLGILLALILYEREAFAQQLRSSSHRYQSLFLNMPDGLAHCRMIFRDGLPVDYEFLEVNPAFVRLSGLQDVVGRKISDLVPGYADDNPEALQTFGRVAQTGVATRWVHHALGSGRWLSYVVYRPAPGEFIQVFEDITQRRFAEQELRKLSLAIEQSPVSIVITDVNGCIEYVNPAFALISGYSSDEIIGKNPRLLQSGRTPPGTYEDLWTTITAGRVWHGNFVNRRKDGTEYFESAVITALRQEDGSITHFVAVKEDVTKLKHATDELRLSESRLRLAKTAVGLGIFDADLLGDTAAWDERTRQLWGVGPLEPINMALFLGGVHPADRAEVQAAIDRARDTTGKGEYSSKYRVINRTDGRIYHIAANGQVFFENERASRLIGMVQDISEQTRLEKEIQERRSEMELLINRQVAAQTAAAIAHELNQPLVAMSAYSEAAQRLLDEGAKQPEKIGRALRGAVEQAHRAGQTLHELLAFLQKGESPQEADRELLDLNRLVGEAIGIAEESGYRTLHPVVELEPDLPPVRANRLQIQKVLVNLLYNSVEAMRDSTSIDPAITISVRTMAGRNMAQVTVQDSGPGFDRQTADRVFEPFFTTKPKGIGLGLAISRALVEAHGGQLWADLDVGPGATFHFTLPLATRARK